MYSWRAREWLPFVKKMDLVTLYHFLFRVLARKSRVSGNADPPSSQGVHEVEKKQGMASGAGWSSGGF